MVFSGNLWSSSKTLSPMTSIQDLQREQESIFFNQITVKHKTSSKGVKSSPGTPDQLSKF